MRMKRRKAMEHNNNSDDLIEIVPDNLPEEDHDIKLAGTETSGETREKETSAQTSEAAREQETSVSASEADREKEVTVRASETETAPEVPLMTPIGAEDDFTEEFEEVEHEQEDYEIVEEIGNSIIDQVDIEIEKAAIEDSREEFAGDNGDDDGSAENTEKDILAAIAAFFRKIPRWGYVVISCSLVVVIFSMWLFMTESGQAALLRLGSKYIAKKVTYQPVTEVEEIEYIPADSDPGSEQFMSGIADVPDSFEVVTPEITPDPEPEEEEKKVYNILLIGEENIDSAAIRGRSDLIMVASLNVDQKTVKLTSILRDSLVNIPNHSDNRINAAYMIGGVSLLYDTLKANLGLEPDNYCLVNFTSFESIINAIGGIDVLLTSQEAEYLNNTNYISKPEYRTVKEGMNHLNGNQALGYCRIRHVPTADRQYSDIGRTSRQRRLLRGIFEKAGRMGYVEMMNFVGECIPYMTTDLDSDTIEKVISTLASINPSGFEEFRIPIEGSYSDVKLRGMLVTSIDLKSNSEALHKFIYGE